MATISNTGQNENKASNLGATKKRRKRSTSRRRGVRGFDMKSIQKNIGSTAGQAVAGTGGFVIAKQISDALRPEDPNATHFAPYINVVAGLLLHAGADNKYLQALGMGIGIEGAIELIRQFDPSLAGLGGLGNAIKSAANLILQDPNKTKRPVQVYAPRPVADLPNPIYRESRLQEAVHLSPEVLQYENEFGGGMPGADTDFDEQAEAIANYLNPEVVSLI